MRFTKALLLSAITGTLLVACQNGASDKDDGSTAPQTEQSLHERLLTLDTHVDIPLNYMIEVDPGWQTEAQVDLPKMVEGGLDAAFLIVYTPQTPLSAQGYKDAAAIAETRYRAIQQLVIQYPDRVALAYTAADVRKIVADGRRAILIGMENAYPLGPDLNKLDMWARRGVRYVGITHFGHNQFGDSSNLKDWDDSDARYGGLSPLGRQLVAKLNDLGVMVDVSHAAKSTMMDAVALSRVPVIASHSGAMGVATSARNLDDEQLRALAAKGGVVQLVALGAYVKAPTAEQTAFVAQMDAKYNVKTSADVDKLPEAERAALMADRETLRAMAPPASV